MSVLDSVLSKLGIGGNGESDTDRVEPAQMMLETRVPKEDNAIWGRFESVEVSLRSLTLTATDGSSETLSLAGTFDLCEEKQVDGSEAVYQLRAPPATYDGADFTMELREFRLQDEAPDRHLEHFEGTTVDVRGEQFEPESGQQWTLTLVFRAREDEDADAYVLEPELEWRQAQ